jgi:hypothetical protein
MGEGEEAESSGRIEAVEGRGSRGPLRRQRAVEGTKGYRRDKGPHRGLRAAQGTKGRTGD